LRQTPLPHLWLSHWQRERKDCGGPQRSTGRVRPWLSFGSSFGSDHQIAGFDQGGNTGFYGRDRNCIGLAQLIASGCPLVEINAVNSDGPLGASGAKRNACSLSLRLVNLTKMKAPCHSHRKNRCYLLLVGTLFPIALRTVRLPLSLSTISLLNSAAQHRVSEPRQDFQRSRSYR
jgi:hypothetical protein